jgi:hypothetical protein
VNLYTVTYRVRVRARDERHALELANAAHWGNVVIDERSEAEDLKDVRPLAEGEAMPPPEVRPATPNEAARRRRNVGDY